MSSLQPMIDALEPRRLLASVPLSVATYNVYYGGGSGPEAFATAFNDMWDNVQDTNIPERAKAIANQIKKHRPDLVGLQEAVIWRTGRAFSDSNANDVRYDFVKEILKHLRTGKTRYAAVSRSVNHDWEFPARVDGSIRDLRSTDQNVILARVGKSSRLRILSTDSGNFRDKVNIDVPVIDDIDFTRGWASVDARVRGSNQTFRFINTHLEVLNQSVQQRQARQLLAGPAKTNLPTIIVGDFNTISGSATHGRFADAGFTDAWTKTNSAFSGPTCCQDEDVRNSSSELDLRIDWILYKGNALNAKTSTRMGEETADKTPSGLWPSDHAGVFTHFRLRASAELSSLDDDALTGSAALPRNTFRR